MIEKIFSVYDEKAGAYLPPFFRPTPEMAIREFVDALENKDHPFGKHPGDYTMFELGDFNNSNAMLISHDAAKNLGNGLEHKRLPSDDEQVDLYKNLTEDQRDQLGIETLEGDLQ